VANHEFSAAHIEVKSDNLSMGIRTTTVIRAALFLAYACSSGAQITPTLNRLSDGTSEIRIRNDATVSLTAFAIRVNDTNAVLDGPLVVYADSVMDTTATRILPNQERVVWEGRRFRTRNGKTVAAILKQPIVTAGIFAEGPTAGDVDLLSRLILRRCNMLQAVEMALDILSDSGKHNLLRDQLIGQFRKMADSLNHWYLPPEQRVGRSLYQSIIGELMNLPEVQAGSPFPPAQYVAQETAALSHQRVALLESQPSLADAAVMRR
jgi:hypothetical protein